MGLRLKRNLYRITRATAVVATVSLALQVYLKNSHQNIELLGAIHDKNVPETQSGTIWDLISNDSNVSTFAKLVGEFDDLVGGLKTPQAKLTVYAPTNEAFQKEEFAPDLPWFYWKFLVGYHMGPGSFSADALSSMNTAPSFVNADIFFKYRQRISTQPETEALWFNRKAKCVKSNIVSI
jgi:Fasciclin domain